MLANYDGHFMEPKKTKKKMAAWRFRPAVLAKLQRLSKKLQLGQSEILEKCLELAEADLIKSESERHRSLAAQIESFSDQANESQKD